jgi:NADPH:quinone reductase-like Zn-dependent oxidoreductase
MAAYPLTHSAVVTPGKQQPLAILEVPTEAPEKGEVVVHVKWTSSSPLDMHRTDGGLLTAPNHILGTSFAGVVVAVGPEDEDAPKPKSAPLVVGDHVFSFTWEKQKQAGFQTYVTVPRHLIGRIPPNLTMEQAVTAPANLVTAFHTITQDLGLALPWPIEQDWKPKQEQEPILIWGGASSVGYFTIQVLRHWGYKNVLVTASKKHHEYLKKLGATTCFDYSDADVTEQINAREGSIQYIIDCIGHLDGTLRPLTRIAQKDTIVAIMMPAILRDATETEPSELNMDPSVLLTDLWKDGVKLIGVRTFFYEKVSMQPHLLEPSRTVLTIA